MVYLEKITIEELSGTTSQLSQLQPLSFEGFFSDATLSVVFYFKKSIDFTQLESTFSFRDQNKTHTHTINSQGNHYIARVKLNNPTPLSFSANIIDATIIRGNHFPIEKTIEILLSKEQKFYQYYLPDQNHFPIFWLQTDGKLNNKVLKVMVDSDSLSGQPHTLSFQEKIIKSSIYEDTDITVADLSQTTCPELHEAFSNGSTSINLEFHRGNTLLYQVPLKLFGILWETSPLIFPVAHHIGCKQRNLNANYQLIDSEHISLSQSSIVAYQSSSNASINFQDDIIYDAKITRNNHQYDFKIACYLLPQPLVNIIPAQEEDALTPQYWANFYTNSENYVLSQVNETCLIIASTEAISIYPEAQAYRLNIVEKEKRACQYTVEVPLDDQGAIRPFDTFTLISNINEQYTNPSSLNYQDSSQSISHDTQERSHIMRVKALISPLRGVNFTTYLNINVIFPSNLKVGYVPADYQLGDEIKNDMLNNKFFDQPSEFKAMQYAFFIPKGSQSFIVYCYIFYLDLDSYTLKNVGPYYVCMNKQVSPSSYKSDLFYFEREFEESIADDPSTKNLYNFYTSPNFYAQTIPIEQIEVVDKSKERIFLTQIVDDIVGEFVEVRMETLTGFERDST